MLLLPIGFNSTISFASQLRGLPSPISMALCKRLPPFEILASY
jgi:hypothetical protein